MIIWGGGSQSIYFNDGGRYNPATDTWRPTSMTNAPSGRWFHAAVWTGSEMIVWGGRPAFDSVGNRSDGARYNPETDTWTPISTNGAPTGRSQMAAVWTGSEMLVWGGTTEGFATLANGARYNPATDTWTPMSADGAPEARFEPTAIWTGTEMIVWGGVRIGGEWVSFNTGARYNPALDTWTPLPTNGAPRRATGHTAVWTGTEMIVWGGREMPSYNILNTGGRYNPMSNSWRLTWETNAPAPRMYHCAVWTGTQMIVWGGQTDPNTQVNTGARYNPDSGVWTPTTQAGAAAKRMFWRPDLGIWTGEGMLICAGSDYPAEVDANDYYLPLAAGTNAPPPVSANHDLSRDFSPTENPNGVWSYGYQTTLGGTVTLLGFAQTSFGDNPVPVNSWSKNGFEPVAVYHNGTTNTSISDGGQGVFPPGATWFYPGIEGHADNYGVIRFTVPAGAAGMYQLESEVQAYLSGPRSGDTDFHVLKNGAELFGRFVPGNSGTAYSNRLSLVEGDTIDFAVGRGQDNIAYDSGLKIQAALSLISSNLPPPPPPSPTYDLSRDFSLASNPNGAWSYGYATSIVGSVTPIVSSKIAPADNGVPIQVWSLSSYEPPAVFHNGSTNTATSDLGQGTFPPGTTWFYAGAEGTAYNYCVIRLRVPGGGAGNYRLETAVESFLNGSRSGDTDFHVVKNGVEIFGQFLAANSGTGYTNTLTLGAGDTIDFRIGRGADGILYGSGLKIQAMLSPASTGAVPPMILTQPQSQTVTVGANATFTVVATGTQPLIYRWRRNGITVGVTTNGSFTLSNVQTNNSANYSVLITNIAGMIISSNATLVVVPSTSSNQPPVISSFSPHSGSVGSSVTISGANFSPVRSNNVVYFGAVRAAITAASANSLTVTVPAGATYAPITVTANRLTAFANAAFLPTFPGIGVLDDTSLAARVDLGASDHPIHAAIGDVDGDGKPDLVAANYLSSTVSIYRNISSGGTLTPGSFAPRVDFPTGPNPFVVTLGDIDGDGRLDLIVVNGGSDTVSVLQNRSTPGSITSGSLAPRVDFPTGGYPIHVAVGDLDGDGKPDIAAVNFNNDSISVLRNTSTGPDITAGSFAPRVDFVTGHGPQGVAIGDLDGDGKPDLVVTAGIVSVLRNTSTRGNITASSFAPKVDFAGGGKSVAIGDLDGDGKPDLALADWGGQAVYLLRNTSAAGTIGPESFAPKLDLPTGGNAHTVALGDLDGDGKSDLAVVTELPSHLSLFKNQSSPGDLTAASFGQRLDFPTGWNPDGVAIGDLDGDGRPEIVFPNQYDDVISIYRITVPSSQPSGFVIRFEPPSLPGGSRLINSWTEHNFVFTTAASNRLAHSDSGASALFPANGGAYLSSVGGSPALIISNVFGNAFSLLGVDLAEYSTVFARPTNVVFVGYRPDGTIASQSFVLDGVMDGTGVLTDFQTFEFSPEFTDLMRVEVPYLPYALDNLRVSVSGTNQSSNQPPVIVSQPVGESASAGGTVTFSVGIIGTAPFSYQWYFDGASIPDATNSSLVLTDVQLDQAGSYWVVVANVAGTATSAGAVLNVFKYQSGGTVNFANAAPGVNAPVFDVDGVTRLSGPAFLAQLYAGPPGGPLVPVIGTAPFQTGIAAGFFFGGTRLISNVAPGQIASVQVRAWEGAYGTTYEQALAAGGRTGVSLVLQLTTGGGPAPPPNLFGLESFSLQPGHSGPPPDITAQPQAQQVLLNASATFSVTASGAAPLRYQWQFNGVEVPGATNAVLTLNNVSATQAGSYSVVVSNPGGSVVSDAADLTVIIERVLAVVSPPDQHEGGLVTVPLELASLGDVGGMTFVLRYDPDYLTAPEVSWDAALDSALKQINVGALGEVRAVFALPATAMPAGTQTVATLTFRARTVPADAITDLNLQLVDISRPTGEPIIYGTDVRSGSVRILFGGTSGDNNGNNRLDVGDATLLLRLLSQLDTTRSWDIGRNDLNQNGTLDSGDVIRVLRVVAGIDPQPGPAGLVSFVPEAYTYGPPRISLASVTAPAAPGLATVSSPNGPRIQSGELVTVQVRFQDLPGQISGASFVLDYPTNALRLVNAQSFRSGPLVPGTALVVWNVSPAQKNFALQNGRVLFAASSATAWPANNGLLAEFTFAVQPGAVSQSHWPVRLGGVEITRDGFDIRQLAPAQINFTGRDTQPPTINPAAGRVTSTGFTAELAGEVGAVYVIEASDDLSAWTTLTTVTNLSGTLQFTDPSAANRSSRFYRARQLE